MNTSKLKSAFEAAMPYLGTICIFVLLFMSTGCSGPESKPSAPIVIHDTVEVTKPFNMYGIGPLFKEGPLAWCDLQHCDEEDARWRDCDGKFHPYIDWVPTDDRFGFSPAVREQGTLFHLEDKFRAQGIPVINEPPSRTKSSSKQSSAPAQQPAATEQVAETTTKVSLPPNEDDEFPWWLVYVLGALAVLVGLWRWATSPREAVGSTRPATDDHGTRHNAPVPVVFVNHHEHTTPDGAITISVPSGGPGVLTEEIEIGTVKVKRTYRGAPNTAAEPGHTGH